MNRLRQLIDDITIFGTNPKVELTNKHVYLKKLLVEIYSEFLNVALEPDETDYDEEPSFNHKEIRENITLNFPDFGWYGTVIEMDNIDDEPALIGDAVDDLADIIKDLLTVKWRFENTNQKDAIWYFQFIMFAHSEQHLVDLLKYLKYKYG